MMNMMRAFFKNSANTPAVWGYSVLSVKSLVVHEKQLALSHICVAPELLM